MALQKRGKWHYGDTHADIRERLLEYSDACGYPAQHFAEPLCRCGGQIFKLLTDENEGVAVRECSKCNSRHFIGDSEEFAEDAELAECECTCGSCEFEIMVGVALYDESNDVRWLYVGCRCPKCDLTAPYADWKNEYENYEKLLKRV